MLVLFLFVSTTFVFRFWGERKLLRCQVGRKFSFPLVCPGHTLAPRPVHLRALLPSRCSSGFLRGFLFRPSGGAILVFFFLLGLVAIFLVLGFGFSCLRAISRCLVSALLFSALRLRAFFFLCLHSCILHVLS